MHLIECIYTEADIERGIFKISARYIGVRRSLAHFVENTDQK